LPAQLATLLRGHRKQGWPLLSLLQEIKRRNVGRIAGLYLVGAWLIVQVASTVLPAFDLPGWALRAVITVLAIGFVPALIFAWVFELTPEGLKREKDIERTASITPHTGKALDRTIMVVLALALGYFGIDKFVLAPQREAQQVEAALKQGHSAALVGSFGDKSIAVLPFIDMSQGHDQEYFSDGIAEELLNLLTKIPQLRVISRSSAFSMKGQNLESPEIGTRLNVAHLLEGSVRKAGNQVRITAQLIDARSDTHLWSETYDRPLDNIFAVQDEIAAAVVAQLKLKLLGAVPKVATTDPKAYALYLQARQLSRQRTKESFEQAVALFNQALALDANYAAAWEGLAEVYDRQAGDGQRPIEEGVRLSREANNKALAIDPEFAPAHARLGRLAMIYDGNLAAAARHFERALALDPTNTDIIGNAATLLISLGRLDAAIALGEYVVGRDPLNPAGHARLGLSYFFAGRLDEAIASYRSVLNLSPGYSAMQHSIGVALLLKGDRAAALVAMQKESSEVWRTIGLPMAWHALGKKAESDAALAELIRKYEKVAPFNIAYVLAYRGEVDRAFEWLDKAVAYHDGGISEIVAAPLFANLHSDPRWGAFLHKIGKSPEQLAAIKFDVKLPQ
jgi:TolB-like protein/lipoprotein NlpI